MASKGGMTPRKQAFANAIAQGKTQVEAAELLGISLRTAARYAANPIVANAIIEESDRLVSETGIMLTAGNKKALDVIRDIMEKETVAPSIRLRAAQIWLEQSFRIKELRELADRVAMLEGARAEVAAAKQGQG